MDRASTPQADHETVWATPVGNIRKDMPVLAPDGAVIGRVAGVEGDQVMLAGGDDFIPITLIDGVGDQGVLLQGRGDATFGLGAQP